MGVENKTEIIKIRISPGDKRLLKAAAVKSGLTLSSFIVFFGKAKAWELGVKLKNIDHPNQTKLFKKEGAK